MNWGGAKSTYGHIPCTMMWQDVASIDDGVTHGLVGVIHADLGSNTPFEAVLGTQSHLLEMF